MTKIIKFSLVITLVALGIYFWFRRLVQQPVGAVPAAQVQPVDTAAKPAAVPLPAITPAPPAVAAQIPFPAEDVRELKPQMQEYAALKKKIFKNDQDSQSWLALLKSPRAIYRARNLLLFRGAEEKTLQDQALSFLIESVKAGEPNAQMALASVIADAGVEDGNAPRPVQQFKAELKAQALYEWSSYEPALSSELQALLPGPVSKKIWQNVVDQQANNAAESDLEIESR
jgi:hypothetical protein